MAAQPSAKSWLQRWLAAFNAPDIATYAAFVKTNIPDLAPYIDEDLGVREASGGYDLLRSEETGAGEITAFVRDHNWGRFSKVVLSLDTHGISDVRFSGATDPREAVLPRLGKAAGLKMLHAKLTTEATAKRFSGTVLIAQKDHVVMREAYGSVAGMRDPAASPNTRYCIGSMGKMFTAVGILQLVQRGRLQLTDTVGKLLSDYPDTSIARTVTVEHLLTHTGGTGDFFGPEYDRHAGELRTPADFIRIFGRVEPAFPAGTRWGYSNLGFILLGAILERVSGTSWDAYLAENVFRKADMSETGPLATKENTAIPQVGAAQTGLKPLPYYVGLPAGGGYSKVDDLNNFAMALAAGALLDARHLALLTTAKVSAGSRNWSLGLTVAARNGASFYGHGGSAPGVNADFAVYPRSGYTVIVLSNRGHPHAANPADFIGARLPDRT
ncbi:CubicO group peptidase (beta-lactamase class C family) [Rhizomicrobium palustre]|uniref:CubicO group peptidase (Beta-lactamase class C family) n=1 Tax=Rhizomicrobium palustre TaxID=189966 RepID=A0A846N2Q5_9PROT|nr:serine hydrolase domain-containing protein [Rhizomicrobium palustre]NIK90016.1 CubicO group peptidase (beta-lactamase class C family) [Rhizomicrobium palustre]